MLDGSRDIQGVDGERHRRGVADLLDDLIHSNGDLLRANPRDRSQGRDDRAGDIGVAASTLGRRLGRRDSKPDINLGNSDCNSGWRTGSSLHFPNNVFYHGRSYSFVLAYSSFDDLNGSSWE